MGHSKQYTGNLNLNGKDENGVESCSNNQDSATKFYNFQEDRSIEKFKVGQIWALYSDIDEYPNYYGLIKKVKWEGSGLTMSVKWLEFLPENDKEKLLLRNDLPVSCGRFQVRGAINHYDSTDAFSHLVHAKPLKKNVSYEIYPNCGEVWAIFKNWNVDVDCEKPRDYGVVEIVEQDKGVVKALSLTKVKGYKYVFMPDPRPATDIQIPIDECLRFSHQIPAFKITNQESGKLKDYWELDPDSIPSMLLSMDP
ncbi:hypothetical protein HPP92_018415 [Vanilla planifolia]|uniref:DUF3444 domain-containing protein n=1 Tax=Vanilla planifolia TaxID=51239 RepID=A0A835Q5P3_VANPL|nr:hypothetical protein HPP92_018415 [Vanilla planifolia]